MKKIIKPAVTFAVLTVFSVVGLGTAYGYGTILVGSVGGGGGTPTDPVVQCDYLNSYMRLGDPENVALDVTKLQAFLNSFEDENLATDGFFDSDTDAAVRRYQIKYSPEILSPWAEPSSTGYVYILTQKHINERFCQKQLLLSDLQLGEILEYRALREALQGAGVGDDGQFLDTLLRASAGNSSTEGSQSSSESDSASTQGGSTIAGDLIVDVVALQEFLRGQGFFTFPTSTGYYGPITIEAIQAFQASRSLSPVGLLGPLTVTEINKTNTNIVDVVAMQELLRSEGFFTFPTSTGFYGPITTTAIQAFQSSLGLSPLGSLGRLTIDELNK